MTQALESTEPHHHIPPLVPDVLLPLPDNKIMTHNVADTPSRSQSTRGLDNSWTGQFAEWSTRWQQIFKTHM